MCLILSDTHSEIHLTLSCRVSTQQHGLVESRGGCRGGWAVRTGTGHGASSRGGAEVDLRRGGDPLCFNKTMIKDSSTCQSNQQKHPQWWPPGACCCWLW